MKTYLVREQDSHSSRLLAVLNASNLDELFWLVDECTDPFACEVLSVPVDGGIYALGEAGILDPSGDEAPDDLHAKDIRRAGSWQELPGDSAWKRFATHKTFERAA